MQQSELPFTDLFKFLRAYWGTKLLIHTWKCTVRSFSHVFSTPFNVRAPFNFRASWKTFRAPLIFVHHCCANLLPLIFAQAKCAKIKGARKFKGIRYVGLSLANYHHCVSKCDCESCLGLGNWKKTFPSMILRFIYYCSSSLGSKALSRYTLSKLSCHAKMVSMDTLLSSNQLAMTSWFCTGCVCECPSTGDRFD